MFLVAANLVPGVHTGGLISGLIGSFVYAIINTVLTAILGLDSGDSFYDLLIQNLLMKQPASRTDQPGLVIVQIDGLAYPILAGRIRAGSVNTMAGWVRDGSHKLSRWEAILPSMTSASQAGILHGNNDGIPAFRWYERDRQHLMVSSNPVDAGEIVRRVSNGEGLLSNNGASICNLVTGPNPSLAAAPRTHALTGVSPECPYSRPALVPQPPPKCGPARLRRPNQH